MAKEMCERKLEKNGIIQVVHYFREKFKKSNKYDLWCDNCNRKKNHAQFYELLGGKIIKLCFHCCKKIDNINTANQRFKK